MNYNPLYRDNLPEGLEEEAYRAFLWNHYQEALARAKDHAEAFAEDDAELLAVLPVLLDKMARPEVNLRGEWDSLSIREHAKYSADWMRQVKEYDEKTERAWKRWKELGGEGPD